MILLQCDLKPNKFKLFWDAVSEYKNRLLMVLPCSSSALVLLFFSQQSVYFQSWFLKISLYTCKLNNRIFLPLWKTNDSQSSNRPTAV